MAINKSKVKTNASSVAKTEATKSGKMVVENILIENLVPDPNNGEDVSITSDLEFSINHNGFNDPIVVTSFGMEEGKYRIVSGHRRTEAMKKLGKTAIPCFIHDFKSEEEISDARESYNLATRDSIKNPMLFVERWKRFSEERKGQKIGVLKSKFAEMTGLSDARVQRLLTTAKLIPEILLMIQNDEVGESSCEPIATMNVEKQNDIYNIMQEAIKDVDGVLTRPNVKKIVEAYKKGVKTWADIKEILFPTAKTNDDTISNQSSHRENNDDEFDGMNPPIDEDDNDDTNSSDSESDFASSNSSENDDADSAIDPNELKERTKGEQIKNQITRLYDNISKEFYTFGSEDLASDVILSMVQLSYELLVSAEEVANKDDYTDKIKEVFKKAFNENMDNLKKFKF